MQVDQEAFIDLAARVRQAEARAQEADENARRAESRAYRFQRDVETLVEYIGSLPDDKPLPPQTYEDHAERMRVDARRRVTVRLEPDEDVKVVKARRSRR